MFEGLNVEDVFALGFGTVVILWGLYRIFTSGKHGSNFLNWLLVLLAGACLYLWQSGHGLDAYLYIKTSLLTPLVD